MKYNDMMLRMGINSIILTLIFFSSCGAQDNKEFKYINDILEGQFQMEYNNYYKNKSSICDLPELSKNYFYGSALLFLDSFNLDSHLKLLYNEYKELKFDSIISILLYDLTLHDRDSPNFVLNHIVFKNNKIIYGSNTYSTTSSDSLMFEKSSKKTIYSYFNNLNLKSGCASRVVSTLKFNQNFELEKTLMIIGPMDYLQLNIDKVPKEYR